MYRRTIQRLLCACLIVLLVSVTVGCTSHSTGSNLLPPQADNPRDYEEIEVVATDQHTFTSFPFSSRHYDASAADQGTPWCTVDASVGDLTFGSSHTAEYRAGWVYFLTSGGAQVPEESSPLYACDKTGTVRTIISLASIPLIALHDFSVSPDGRFVVVYDYAHGTGPTVLYVWSVEQQKMIASFSADDSAVPASGNDPEDHTDRRLVWVTPKDSDYWHATYWHERLVAGQPSSYTYTAMTGEPSTIVEVLSFATIQFTSDTTSHVTVQRHLVPDTIPHVYSEVFDPTTSLVAYDDYPQVVEHGSEVIVPLDRAQTPTHLFLYNVITGVNTCIDERPACRFDPQWTGPDTLEYNAAHDPVDRVWNKPVPTAYVSRTYTSLLARSDCLPIVYSVTSSDGENEEYHYAVIDLTTMKIFKDDGVIATSRTIGTQSWLFFPRTSPWQLNSETVMGTPREGVTPVGETSLNLVSFKVGNKLYSGREPFTPSQTLLDAVTDISGEITDPGILRVIECTPSSSSGVGIQCAIDRIEGESQGKLWFYTRYTFLYEGTVDRQIEFRQNQKSITTVCKNPKAGGAPSIIADTLAGVNNLFVPVAMKFPHHG